MPLTFPNRFANVLPVLQASPTWLTLLLLKGYRGLEALRAIMSNKILKQDINYVFTFFVTPFRLWLLLARRPFDCAFQQIVSSYHL